MGYALTRFSDIIGQESSVSRLKAYKEFLSTTKGTPGHILVIGEEGMGQSAFATALANELDVALQRVDSTDLQIVGDVTMHLTSPPPGKVLFLSRSQLLRKPLLERFGRAMRTGELEIVIGMGPASRRHVMQIPKLTIFATCPTKTECPVELLHEFSLVLSLQQYSVKELSKIAEEIAVRAGISLEESAADLLATNCDGRPRHLEQLFHRFARAINKGKIFEEDIRNAFEAFGITMKSGTKPNGTSNLQSLSGQDFEYLITALLSRMGFEAQMTKTSGDGGIDIIAEFDKPIFGGRYLFQCKRFASDNLVGAPTVRDFFGAVMAERAVKGIFVTTSEFTAQAREFAQKAGVELIDSNQLHKLLAENGLSDPQVE